MSISIPVLMALACMASDPLTEVSVTLDEFHRAASAADAERYFGLMTEDAVYLGTDASERWSVAEFRAYAEPYFSKGTGWTYVASERHIDFSATGEVAWFDERLQNEKYGEVRGSGVIERVGEAWRISQYNLSFPVMNEHAKAVVKKTLRLEESGQPRGEQHYAMDGERGLSIWNKVVAKRLELPAEERPVIVLLPSATFSARATWDLGLRDYSVMNMLARRGFDVFAVDVGGYGLSSQPQDVAAGGARSAARDVLIALDYINELRGTSSVVLVGHSWGAQVAGLFANEHPERVRGLVLYGMNWRSRIPEEVVREAFGDEVFDQNTRMVTAEAARADFIDGFHEDDVQRAFTRHLLSQGKSVPTGALRDLTFELPLVDPARLPMPTLVLYGRMEFEWPDSEAEGGWMFAEDRWRERLGFFGALPGPRHWIEVPDAGHTAHLFESRVMFQRCLAGWIERLP